MKLTEIQDLIKFVAKAGVNEVEIEQKDFKITIKSDSLARKKSNVPGETQVVQQQIPVVTAPMTAPLTAAPVAPAAVPEQASSAAVQEHTKVPSETESKSDDSANYITVKSPMIGTFYRRPTPDKPLFVEVGDTVKEGDVLCIVEAMKLFNEIESEVSGRIVKVLVDDSSPIEYDQPLFLVDPS